VGSEYPPGNSRFTHPEWGEGNGAQPPSPPSLLFHSLKYQRCTTLGCKDIGIRISEFVAKTQIPSKYRGENPCALPPPGP